MSVQANNTDREVLVVSASLCRLVTDPATTRDIAWASADCLVSWL